MALYKFDFNFNFLTLKSWYDNETVKDPY